MASAMFAPEPVKQWWGIYYGYIAVNQDPTAKGRVKLRVPQVFGNATSGWASPMVPLYYVPPVSTPVCVMFVGGDPTLPVWFGNFPVPPTSGIVFSPTAPTDPTVGAIWVNTVTGLMSEWNGASWIGYQIGGAAIQTGAALDAPDITGGTITGARSLDYAGTPGAGNLIASVAPDSVQFQDDFGNWVLPGFAAYEPGSLVAWSFADGVTSWTTASLSDPWTTATSLVLDPVDGAQFTTMPWQPLTLVNGWANHGGNVAAQYRLGPLRGQVEVIGTLDGSAATSATFANLPYTPASQQMACAVTSTGWASGFIQCATTGALSVQAASFGGVWPFRGFVSLDA